MSALDFVVKKLTSLKLIVRKDDVMTSLHFL